VSVIGNWLVGRDRRESTAVARLAAHLQEHAAEYWAEFVSGPPSVRLVSHATRPDSQNDLYEFSLSYRSVERRIIVKVRFPWKAATRPEAGHLDRLPDLYGLVETQDKTGYEFAAMSALMASMARHPDERFGFVRVFGVLEEPHALIMEKRPEENLRQLLVSAHAKSGETSDLIPAAMRNAGAWLRWFHAFPDLSHTETRGARVSELVDSMVQLTKYLCERVRCVRFLEGICSELVESVGAHLPDQLPLGLSHGDFSLGNVLVGAHGRAKVLDTFARWRKPIYEDISQFLVALKFPGPRWWRARGGAAVRIAEQCEREFLAGYFAGESVPWGTIRLYECRFLLMRWAWLVHGSLETRGWRRIEKACGLAVWSWFVRRLLDRLVLEADKAMGSKSSRAQRQTSFA